LKNLLAPLDQLAQFDEIVDVRTPLEFAEDHIPGAINAPVLSNEERVIVGTMYKQVSPFEATRVGAAMVARNIAHHLETTFAGRPRNWRPLIYCWRGGKRSGSMTTWFNLIGWQARQLEGGYKTYRRSVLDTLGSAPCRFACIALIGHTGTGKTRLLHALREAGAQVLDLEGLACHRGSLLGALPDRPQPGQKAFDTALAGELARFDARRLVFVEAESRRIGAITLPDALLAALHRGVCVDVAAPRDARITFLLQDYAHLFDNPAGFRQQLDRLVGLHSREQVMRWHQLVDAGSLGDLQAREQLFGELIERHYDPAYLRSSRQHFSRLGDAVPFVFQPNAADSVAQQARTLLAQLAAAGVSGLDAAPARTADVQDAGSGGTAPARVSPQLQAHAQAPAPHGAPARLPRDACAGASGFEPHAGTAGKS
jgi:tRNA 2-selenouridine synthase